MSFQTVEDIIKFYSKEGKKLKTIDSFYVLTDLSNRSFECEDGSGGEVLDAKRFSSYGQAFKFADDNKIRSRQYPVEISIVIN